MLNDINQMTFVRCTKL